MTRRDVLRAILAGAMSLPMISSQGAEAGQKLIINIESAEDHSVSLLDQSSYQASFRTLYSGVLSFFNVQTDESIRARYLAENGELDPEGCDSLSRFFKSPHDEKGIPIDTSLFLFLDAVSTSLGAGERHYLLFSGYRSPAYNRMLSKRNANVARGSYHMKGMAADISLEDVFLRDIEKAAKALNLGGVGRYGKYVHLDVGPVRCWRS